MSKHSDQTKSYIDSNFCHQLRNFWNMYTYFDTNTDSRSKLTACLNKKKMKSMEQNMTVFSSSTLFLLTMHVFLICLVLFVCFRKNLWGKKNYSLFYRHHTEFWHDILFPFKLLCQKKKKVLVFEYTCLTLQSSYSSFFTTLCFVPTLTIVFF